MENVSTRDFTVAVFVMWQNQTLLHKHKKLDMWLPCGGHIEPDELPDEAAVREVLEESGVDVELIGEKVLDISDPVQLVRPRGIQLESISERHEHIDLIYFARPLKSYAGYLLDSDPSLGWYSQDDCRTLGLNEEITKWLELLWTELT